MSLVYIMWHAVPELLSDEWVDQQHTGCRDLLSCNNHPLVVTSAAPRAWQACQTGVRGCRSADTLRTARRTKPTRVARREALQFNRSRELFSSPVSSSTLLLLWHMGKGGDLI